MFVLFRILHGLLVRKTRTAPWGFVTKQQACALGGVSAPLAQRPISQMPTRYTRHAPTPVFLIPVGATARVKPMEPHPTNVFATLGTLVTAVKSKHA